MTTTDQSDQKLRQAVLDLIGEIELLAKDFEPEVKEILESAAPEHFSAVVAERLYTRILLTLRQAKGEPTDGVASEVRRLLDEAAEATEPWGRVKLVARNGLTPHLVSPVPTFNNVAVDMWEGYVDVTQLELWEENLRVELYVREFVERNNRRPDPSEMFQLMYGKLSLKEKTRDPFKMTPLIKSIARKGVERPPILTFDGEPKDGNRRIAASRYIVENDFAPEEKERARWIKVWVAPPDTTDDQFEAVVVALNFEDDLKERWPEYVKARMVVREYREARDHMMGGSLAVKDKALRERIARQFAITPGEVVRYLRMVQWAEDFEDYHVNDRNREPAEVRYRANEVFQWFYEIQAGRSADKITNQIEEDLDLRKKVYDLMFDAMDSGAQVRSLYKIVADDEAMHQLDNAHERLLADDKKSALELVKEAVTIADRNTSTRKKIGFESFLLSAVSRLEEAPPVNWQKLPSKLLHDLRRAFVGAIGVLDAELERRGEKAVVVHD